MYFQGNHVNRLFLLLVILFFCILNASCVPFGGRHTVITSPILTEHIVHYENYPANVKRVIFNASLLSRKKLGYRFGSATPRNGAMDCSGTIYYILRNIRYVDVPRDSYSMYKWLLRAGTIHHVTTHRFNSSQFNALKPGDLLFWTGTYKTHRKPPITHVMLYLGKDENNKPLMFGSSDGGIYKHKEMWGVSVFEFILPRSQDKIHFAAYGCIPSFTC